MTRVAGDVAIDVSANVGPLVSSMERGSSAVSKFGRTAESVRHGLKSVEQAQSAAARAIRQSIPSLNNATKSARDSARAFEEIERQSRRMKDIRGAFDPAYAAAQRFQRAVNEVNGAIESGAIDLREGQMLLKRIRDEYNNTGIAAQRFGRSLDGSLDGMSNGLRAATTSSGAFGRGIQNAAFQVGDFAVQVGGGTSAVRAMSMQLPQLLGGFGVMGAVAGAAVAIIGPLAQALFRVGESAEDAAREFDGLGSSLGSMRGQISTLASLQNDLNNLHRAQAGASAAGASAVIANSQKEFDARRQLIEVERTLLQLRSQDAQQALKNLQDQQEMTRNAMQETLRNIGPGATDSRERDAGGFAGGGVRMTDLETAIGADAMRAMRDRTTQIKRLEAELKLVEIASDEAADALKGVFKAGEVEGGGPLEDGGAGGGGSGKNPLQSRLESLNAALSTERETLEAWRAESLELLNSFNAAELEELGVHRDAKLRIEEEYQRRLAQIKQQEYAAQISMASGFFSEAAGLMTANNKKLFEIGKTAAIASAIINTYEGITQALAKYPPPMSYAYAALTAAKGFAQVSAIKSQTFGGGSAGATGATGAAAVPAAANTSPRVALTLAGSENAMFSKDQVRDLINAINEEVEGGAIVRLA